MSRDNEESREIRSDRVTLTYQDGVAEVRLNRPEKRNALDLAMFESLVAAGEEIANQPEVRAVVLSGEGPAFCAGLDFMSMMALSDSVERLLSREEGHPDNLAQRAAWVWHTLPIPVIAALHGATLGGGLQVALGADMRFSTPDAKLSVMEIKWGLCPDMSLSKTLPPLVGLDVAKWLTYTAEVIDGERASTLGLVTRVCADPRAEALETARSIAARSPHAIRACKRLLNESVSLNVSEAFLLEERLQRGLIASPNQLEAVQANFMKRPPLFADPLS